MVKKFNFITYLKHLTKPNTELLKKQITEEITDTDLTRYFGKRDLKNILKYSELANYKSIQQLLPRNKSWKIILVEKLKKQFKLSSDELVSLIIQKWFKRFKI